MSIRLDHTIVFAKDRHRSATFLADVLGLPAPQTVGHFTVVAVDNGVNLDFMDTDGDVHSQHYAFVVPETSFDEIRARVLDHGLDTWADPYLSRPGEVGTHGSNRGFYFFDPSQHLLEVRTEPSSITLAA